MRAIELLTAVGTGNISLTHKRRRSRDGNSDFKMESGSDKASDAVYSTDSQIHDMHISELGYVEELEPPSTPRFKMRTSRGSTAGKSGSSARNSFKTVQKEPLMAITERLDRSGSSMARKEESPSPLTQKRYMKNHVVDYVAKEIERDAFSE
jgi:hypothetical protein